MWVDFLLKETEEREKRGSVEDTGRTKEDSQGKSPNAEVPNYGTGTASVGSGVSVSNFSPTQNYSPLPSQGNLQPFAHSDSEFSTVPLTSTDSTYSTSRISRLLAKH